MTADPSGRYFADPLDVLCSGMKDDGPARAIASALIDWSRGIPGASHVPLYDLSPATIDARTHFAAQNRVQPACAAVLGQSFAHTGFGAAPLVPALEIVRCLVTVTRSLAGSGIASLVVKGLATGHVDYARPDDRQTGDVDLIVRPSELEPAIEALETIGFERRVTHPFSTPRFFHSETLVGEAGIEVDVHQRFSQASRAPRTIWDDPTPFEVGSVQLLAPAMRWRFVHACVHQMMNPPPGVRRLSGLLDAYRILSSPGFSLREAMLAAREIHMEAVVGACVKRMYEVIEEPLPPLVRSASGWSDRWLATLVDGTDPIPGYASLLTSLANQRWRDWPRYMRELAWPTKAYREEIGRSPLGQLIHIAREAAGR